MPSTESRIARCLRDIDRDGDGIRAGHFAHQLLALPRRACLRAARGGPRSRRVRRSTRAIPSPMPELPPVTRLIRSSSISSRKIARPPGGAGANRIARLSREAVIAGFLANDRRALLRGEPRRRAPPSRMLWRYRSIPFRYWRHRPGSHNGTAPDDKTNKRQAMEARSLCTGIGLVAAMPGARPRTIRPAPIRLVTFGARRQRQRRARPGRWASGFRRKWASRSSSTTSPAPTG